MADKEFLLGNKARELLRYTNQATRVVSDDVSVSNVRAIIKRIASLSDIRDVNAACTEITHVLNTKDRDGFSKSKFRLYGEDMREIAKGIVRDIQAANNVNFQTEYDERLRRIEDALDGCSLLLEYVLICLEEGIISKQKSGVWTKKITDVKYMTAAWKRNDGGRARKLREAAETEAMKKQAAMMQSVVRAVLDEREAERRRAALQQKAAYGRMN